MKQIYPVRQTRCNEKGQMILIVAISMVMLIALAGLAVDAAMLYLEKQNLTRAVDAACLAAANKLPDQAAATSAAYEFMRMHGYDFDPITKPMDVTFPVTVPARKTIAINASIKGKFYFMRFLGWDYAAVEAEGEGESAPMDVYLVLDTSSSMTSDTNGAGKPKPANWYSDYPYYGAVCGTSFPKTTSGADAAWANTDCMRKYCNRAHICDPFDKGIKPAAKSFVDKLSGVYDRIGVVTFNKFGQTEISLTNDMTAVKGAIDNMVTYEQSDLNTNIGDGLQLAHTRIASEGRVDAIWSIVFMTDGAANCKGNQTNYNCPGYGAGGQAETFALNIAKNIWGLNEVSVYTIGYGVSEINKYPNAVTLLKDIADWTDDGKHDGVTANYFYAPNAAALQSAFSEIADRIYTRLIR